MAEQKKDMIAPGKIYAAIAGVIADVGYVAKDKVNRQQGFKFRSVDDVYNALHPALAKNKVFIVPRVLEQKREKMVTAKGTEMVLVICKIQFRFYTEDGSFIETVMLGEALDTGDKATNKAMAIAYKYACFQVFCIPTEELQDDPDKERPELETDEKKTVQKTSVKGTKSNSAKKEEAAAATQSEEEERITPAMLNTIRAEQKRTGVADKVILGRKMIKSKSIEELTVSEFKYIMDIFKKTADLPGGEASE